VRPVCRRAETPRRKPFQVSDKCQNHRVCMTRLACPAFYVWNDRIKIDATLCTGPLRALRPDLPENAILPAREEKK